MGEMLRFTCSLGRISTLGRMQARAHYMCTLGRIELIFLSLLGRMIILKIGSLGRMKQWKLGRIELWQKGINLSFLSKNREFPST